MPGPLIRRLRLTPAPTSPAVARGAIDGLLTEAKLDHLRDEALLLTSELVTNAVLHAGTEIEIEMAADPEGLRVAVTDFGPPAPELLVTEVTVLRHATTGAGKNGPTRPYPQIYEARPAEGGRGLLLVNRFASRWGTTHEAGGRAVWFQLDTGREGDGRPSRDGHGRTAIEPAPDIDTILTTVVGADGSAVRRPDGAPGSVPERSLDDLVERLARGLSAASATVTVDRADGLGAQVLARYGSGGQSAPDGRTVRVPLPLSRPWVGEFTATGARTRHAEPVAAIIAGQLALIIENERLQQAHNDGRGWLLFLAEAGELLAQSMNVELTVALIPRLVVPRLGRWCAVHLTNEYGELTRAALTHSDEAAIAGLAEAIDERLSRFERVLAGDAAVPLGPPTDGVSLPLAVRSERLGTLTVGRPAGRSHSADELAIIEDLCRRAAVAIENARIHDNRSRIATTLQQPLLPPALPSIDGLETAAAYVPAGDGVDIGGDFYDIVAVPATGGDRTAPPQGWMLVVGDVSGKGVAAAAVTGLVREVLHTLAGDHREPEHTLRRLNATLVERGGGYFCTLALAFLTPLAGGGFGVSLHLAGHEKPVLLRADGSTSLVGESGTALGLVETVHTPRTALRLESGDALVFYTDGVTERRRGSTLYGQDRLCQKLATLTRSPATVIASGLRASVLEFSPQQPRDDIAIVALRAV